MPMKKCRDFCEQFSDYLEGEISIEECRQIEEHLAACSTCSVIYKSLKTAIEVSKLALEDKISDEVRDRLKTLLRQHCKDQECQP